MKLNSGIYHIDHSCPYHGVHLAECGYPESCQKQHYRMDGLKIATIYPPPDEADERTHIRFRPDGSYTTGSPGMPEIGGWFPLPDPTQGDQP